MATIRVPQPQTFSEFFTNAQEHSKRSRLGYNAFVVEGPLRAYLRATSRYYDRSMRSTYEIGSVVVSPSRHRRKGHFKKFLFMLMQQTIADGRWLMVESVNNPHLAKYLLTQDFVRDGNNYWFVPKPSLV